MTRTLMAFVDSLNFTGCRLSIRESVQGFKTQAVLCQTVSQCFLVEIDGDEMENEFLDKDNKTRCEQSLQNSVRRAVPS